MQLMKSDHPRWEKFCERLAEKLSIEGCHSGAVEKTNGQLSFKDDSEAFSYSLLILDEMGFDSRWSAQYFH
jgi:hypothetical protein